MPQGYQQGIITAITVLIGFSLTFLRFWGLELKGAWTGSSIIATIAVVGSLVLQFVALFRSLDPNDEQIQHYRETVRYFGISAITLALGILVAVIGYSLP